MYDYNDKAIEILEILVYMQDASARLQTNLLCVFGKIYSKEMGHEDKFEAIRNFFEFIDSVNKMCKDVRGHEMWIEQLRLEASGVKRK